MAGGMRRTGRTSARWRIAVKVLVTGATGFVGQTLVPMLRQAGHEVIPAGRRPGSVDGLPVRVVGDLGPGTDWLPSLSGCEAVVHLAARVHVMDAAGRSDVAGFRRINVLGTEHLARQAARVGARRLVHVSTVKVHGEHSPGRPFTEDDVPRPSDAYALSKWEAEEVLRRVASETGLETVVLRPPLVYGPGVGANFAFLLRAVRSGWPLPFGAVHNRRSLVYVGNLCDAIAHCLGHPAAAGEVFLVDDGAAVSTAGLIRAVAAAVGRTPCLLPVPVALLKFAGRITGRQDVVQRLLGDLEVDGSRIRRACGWRPPTDLAAALRTSFARA